MIDSRYDVYRSEGGAWGVRSGGKGPRPLIALARALALAISLALALALGPAFALPAGVQPDQVRDRAGRATSHHPTTGLCPRPAAAHHRRALRRR